ncbi:MAG: substrate-binding periplasmic protein [Desulfovibrio aminophilus]|uniref:substrate-binding periplasmic protein n=1 Tax=Desulfovibrio aminophilus TaxID=81425 RepID=UPI0039EA5295
MTTGVVQAILAGLGQNLPIGVYPWARAYHIALTEPNVVIFTAGKTPDRVAQGFSFIGPVTTRRHALFKKTSRKLTVRNLDDVKSQGLKVGAMRGDWRAAFLESRGMTVELVTGHHQNLMKLLDDRIDLIVLSDLELPITAAQAGIDRAAVETALVFDERQAYILLSKGTQESVLTQWRESFHALQSTDFFQQQSRKWSEILDMPISYAPDTGFMVVPASRKN